MTSRARRTGQGRLIGWIGWAGLDAIGRLALLTGSTIVFSRLLAPRDFGVTALVLTLVAVAAVFVGSPFEEALAQRRGVRMAHLRAALGASWAIGAVILAASIPLGHALAEHYGEPEFRSLLPVAMASVFFSGHSDIVTALARRLRRFNDVAYATLVGHVVGVGVALAIGLAGYGLWALIAQRLMVVVARAVILQWRIGFLVTPSWAPALVREFGRFAGFSFMARLAENLTYLAFNNLVQIFYGVAALGQVNMAMRLIEPIRAPSPPRGTISPFPILPAPATRRAAARAPFRSYRSRPSSPRRSSSGWRRSPRFCCLSSRGRAGMRRSESPSVCRWPAPSRRPPASSTPAFRPGGDRNTA